MKIYTKTGDEGTSSLVGGARVLKTDIRLSAYGTVDELNSFLGLLRTELLDDAKKETVLTIQKQLFLVGGSLATDGEEHAKSLFPITEDSIMWLECEIDKIMSLLPPLKNFIVPGDNRVSALCHVCRTVARRAEREILKVGESYWVDKNIRIYMNRLSDYLFVLSRAV